MRQAGATTELARDRTKARSWARDLLFYPEVSNPVPTPLHPPTFAERFWILTRAAEPAVEEEPERSIAIVRYFLAALDGAEALPARTPAAGLISMLRHAELDGDLSYASPEQVRGEMVDARSLVFSLGVVLFEKLTGKHPFGAENNRPRRIDRIRRGELGSGVNSFPTVAAGLRSVLVRAMSPFSEERWTDLRHLRELLGQFVAQQAPAPRLPGTAGDEGVTKVVRLATDFGRDLSDAVARHDRPATRPPPLPGGRTSQRLAIPTAGLGVATGATTASAAGAPAPRGGVIPLRPATRAAALAIAEAPAEREGDSVLTQVRTEGVDPLGATMKLVVDEDDLRAAQAAEEAEEQRVRREPIAAPEPVAARLAPAPHRTAPAFPTLPPAKPKAPTPAMIAAHQARTAAARMRTPSPFPLPPPTDELSPAEAALAASLTAGSPRKRTALIAGLSACVGAIVAVVIVVNMQAAEPGAASAAAPAPVAAPIVAPIEAPAAIAEAPKPVVAAPAAKPVVPKPAPVAAAPAPKPAPAIADAAPAPAPVSEPAPAPAPAPIVGDAISDGATETDIAQAIASCIPDGHKGVRVVGLSLLYKGGAVQKPYWSGTEGMTPAERGCAGRALRGLAPAGAPDSGVLEYTVKLQHDGVHVSSRGKH